MRNPHQLEMVYRKTDGCCHICHRKLSFRNYAVHGAKGAWHIDHSNAKANGGSDHLNNLFAACISCNCEKGAKTTQIMRKKYGTTRAPYNKAKKQQIKDDNTIIGMVSGGLAGSAFGPGGIIIGSIIGGLIGEDVSPDR